MTKELEITSKVDAKGRNGWFAAKSVDVWTGLGADCNDGSVEIFSKVKGARCNPPIVVNGDRKELAQLFAQIAAALQRG